MDHAIERKFCVYFEHRNPLASDRTLISCPFDQHPPDVTVVHTGTQQQCERYMRDMHRLAEIANGRK